MRSWRAAVLCFCALVSAVLIVTSLSLGYHLSRPVPFYDQWEFVRRINDIQAGRFGFADLVAQHNEHRIATARAVFLLDLWLADGTGYLSIAVLYLALGAIAALLARCFADSKPLALTVFLSCFALLVAPAQWENLSSGFQVQFPFVDLFAMSSLSCLIAAMAQVQRRERTWLLLTAASLFDMLAVFSMASGTLLLIPALWIGLVLRSSPRVFVAFVVSHLVACLLFALGYTRITGIPPVFDPILLMQYALVYMGAALRGYPHGPLALGLIDALCLLASMGTMLVRSRAGPTAVDRIALFAASVALLLVANALLTAIGRASFGVASAVASRYSLQSLLLQPALLIVVWRQSRAWLSAPGMRFAFGSALLAAGTALSLLASLIDRVAPRMAWPRGSIGPGGLRSDPGAVRRRGAPPRVPRSFIHPTGRPCFRGGKARTFLSAIWRDLPTTIEPSCRHRPQRNQPMLSRFWHRARRIASDRCRGLGFQSRDADRRRLRSRLGPLRARPRRRLRAPVHPARRRRSSLARVSRPQRVRHPLVTAAFERRRPYLNPAHCTLAG